MVRKAKKLARGNSVEEARGNSAHECTRGKSAEAINAQEAL